ncbi:heat shock cognate 70 kDa protein [Tanacetum coccineum]
MKSWPFKIIEGLEENPKIVVDFKGEVKKFSPEELSAMVLKKIKSFAEEFLGTKVTDAVITVPAHFNNKQREATKEAGTIAGLNVMRLINEPTAAAIAYGVDNTADREWDKDKTVLVFDLGGGTFDVSVLTVSKTGTIDVKAVGGDTHLGGDDFDTTLVNHCINEFKKKHKEDISGNTRALGRLKVFCEKAKRDLSSTTFTQIEIDSIHKNIDFSIKISRAKFEELNATLFDRIPKVQRMLKEYFGGKTLCKNMKGDEAVAFGAAILADKLSGYDNDSINDVILLDVTPLSLGVGCRRRGLSGQMAVIISRNTSIPTSKTETFYSDADKTRVAVYQGESNETKDNMLLGELFLQDLAPAGLDERLKVEVCFSLDVNGILQVYAENVAKGQRERITIAYS